MKMSSFSRKAQGLPIYVIGVIILGIIVLGLVLVFLLGTSGKGKEQAGQLFSDQDNFVSNASETVAQYTGKSSLKLETVISRQETSPVP